SAIEAMSATTSARVVTSRPFQAQNDGSPWRCILAPRGIAGREIRAAANHRGVVILPMSYRLLADALVGIHFAFIAFAIGGGLFVLLRLWVALLHLPSVAWAIYTELTGAICPLTPWEQALRHAAGQAGYTGGFIEHYLIPVIYPAGLTPAIQTALGVLVFVLNA